LPLEVIRVTGRAVCGSLSAACPRARQRAKATTATTIATAATSQRTLVARDVAKGLIAVLAVLDQALADEPLQLALRVLVGMLDRPRLRVQHLVQRVDERLPFERLLRRDGFVDDAAEREDVGALIDRLA
jgi:hypothetical protein